MKEIELFYLKTCPYCRNAKRAIDELIEENPAYADIQIDESAGYDRSTIIHSDHF